MVRNIGSTDRVLRVIVGLLLIVLPFLTAFAAGAPWLRWAMVLVGAVLVATALARSCPLYRVLGLSTCRLNP